jgi:hypothetical protein
MRLGDTGGRDITGYHVFATVGVCCRHTGVPCSMCAQISRHFIILLSACFPSWEEGQSSQRGRGCQEPLGSDSKERLTCGKSGCEISLPIRIAGDRLVTHLVSAL